jgi:hypothetical protein
MSKVVREKLPIEKINRFILETKPTESPQFNEARINQFNAENLGNSEFKISMKEGKYIMEKGGQEIKFGKEGNKSYGEYLKETYKANENVVRKGGTPEEIKNNVKEQSKLMAKEMAESMYGKDAAQPIVDAFQNRIQLDMNVEIKRFELSNPRSGLVELSPDVISDATNPTRNRSNAVDNGKPPEPAKAVAKEVVNANEKTKSLEKKTPEELKKATEKVYDEKIKEAKTPEEKEALEKEKSSWKDKLKWGLGIALASFFTYEALSAHAAARSGCFVVISDPLTGSTSTCKIPILTCDKDAAAAGTLCSFSIDNGWCAAPQTGGTLSPGGGCSSCSDGFSQACSDECRLSKDSPCSKYCSTTYMVKSANGKNYDYTCVDCDIKCALNDLANKVTEILGKVADTFESGLDLLNNIFKYGMYFIIGFIVLYCLYWLITKFAGGGDKHQGGEEHIVIEQGGHQQSGESSVPRARPGSETIGFSNPSEPIPRFQAPTFNYTFRRRNI